MQEIPQKQHIWGLQKYPTKMQANDLVGEAFTLICTCQSGQVRVPLTLLN
jgi:hypothetical protein